MYLKVDGMSMLYSLSRNGSKLMLLGPALLLLLPLSVLLVLLLGAAAAASSAVASCTSTGLSTSSNKRLISK
jgi:hypothetical protein